MTTATADTVIYLEDYVRQEVQEYVADRKSDWLDELGWEPTEEEVNRVICCICKDAYDFISTSMVNLLANKARYC